MERTITVDIKTAREWFLSGNDTLRTLALRAFSKEELDVNPQIKGMIEEMIIHPNTYNLNESRKAQLHELQRRSNYEKTSAQKLLRVLALYFNKGWKRDNGNTGYFIYYNFDSLEWTVKSHSSINYPIPYFKSFIDCEEAIKILKSLDKLESLYVDL